MAPTPIQRRACPCLCPSHFPQYPCTGTCAYLRDLAVAWLVLPRERGREQTKVRAKERQRRCLNFQGDACVGLQGGLTYKKIQPPAPYRRPMPRSIGLPQGGCVSLISSGPCKPPWGCMHGPASGLMNPPRGRQARLGTDLPASG